MKREESEEEGGEEEEGSDKGRDQLSLVSVRWYPWEGRVSERCCSHTNAREL